MKKIKTYSVTRSNTKQQLPNINIKTPRIGGLAKNKSYLGQLGIQFSGNAQYDDMEQTSLIKQQRRLKQVLRKMNDDTVKIIADYTPRVKKVHKHNLTATSILAVKQKQVQNNHKIMSQCQAQIEKLIQRAQNLNSGGKQHFDNIHSKILDQIQIIQQEIINLKQQNGRRGNNIVTQQRIIQQGEMRRLQTDVYLAQHKASHLRADDQRVQQQIKQYQRKLKQIHQKAIYADKFFKQEQKKNKQKQNLMSNQYELIHKKIALQNNKKKSDFYNQNYQYRYLSLLRQLEMTTNTMKQVQSKIDKSFVQIQASKMIINKLEAQLKSMRLKKKQIKNQVSQFFRKTKNQEQKQQKQNSSRIGNLNSKQMPSQISIKQQLNGDNSYNDLDQQIAGLIVQQNTKNENENSNEIKQKKKQEPIQNKQHRQDVLLNQL